MATSGSFEVVVDGSVQGGNYATREEAERAAAQLRTGAASGKNVVIREGSGAGQSMGGSPGQGDPHPAPSNTQESNNPQRR